MGLPPEFFAKEELASLRQRLQGADADAERQRAASRLSDCMLQNEGLAKENHDLCAERQEAKQALSDVRQENADLRESIAAGEAERLTKERNAAALHEQFLAIKAVNTQLVKQATELTIRRDGLDVKWHRTLQGLATAKSCLVDRAAEYAEREARLAEKSEQLQTQKAELREQQQELNLR